MRENYCQIKFKRNNFDKKIYSEIFNFFFTRELNQKIKLFYMINTQTVYFAISETA